MRLQEFLVFLTILRVQYETMGWAWRRKKRLAAVNGTGPLSPRRSPLPRWRMRTWSGPVGRDGCCPVTSPVRLEGGAVLTPLCCCSRVPIGAVLTPLCCCRRYEGVLRVRHGGEPVLQPAVSERRHLPTPGGRLHVRLSARLRRSVYRPHPQSSVPSPQSFQVGIPPSVLSRLSEDTRRSPSTGCALPI